VDVVKIGLGDRAEVAFDAYPGVAFVGQVSEIAAGAEPMSGTFEVEVALEPQEQKLKDGFVGKVQIFPRQGQAQLRIPMDALVEAEPGRALVYVPDADKQGAQPLWLEGYQLREDYILLPRSRYPELKAVVTAGAKYLRADARIRVVAPEGSKSLAVSDRID
jgi:multidrug efflux system membrane fusion protein